MKKIWYDENGDARCGKCMRLLYKCKGGERPAGVEIKCHSCKEVNVSEYRFCRRCKWYQDGACMNAESIYATHTREETDTCEKWEKSNGQRD